MKVVLVHRTRAGGMFGYCVCGRRAGPGLREDSSGHQEKGGIVEETGHSGTESGITRRNRSQSEQKQDRTRPPTTATPQNLGISTFRPHHNNQPLLAPQPESTKSWTKSENKTPKPIQSTIAPTFTAPPTTATSQNRGISAIHPRRSSNRKPATRQQARIHGPNRRTRDEIGTGPQQRQTALGLQSRCLPHKPTPE